MSGDYPRNSVYCVCRTPISRRTYDGGLSAVRQSCHPGPDLISLPLSTLEGQSSGPKVRAETVTVRHVDVCFGKERASE